jgi:energy-converting hydrogenase A subunit D
MQGATGVDDLLALLFGTVAVAGATIAFFQHNPFSKVIAVGIILGGVVPFIVDRGYLDVAIAVSLIVPVTTIIILQVIGRGTA